MKINFKNLYGCQGLQSEFALPAWPNSNQLPVETVLAPNIKQKAIYMFLCMPRYTDMHQICSLSDLHVTLKFLYIKSKYEGMI